MVIESTLYVAKANKYAFSATQSHSTGFFVPHASTCMFLELGTWNITSLSSTIKQPLYVSSERKRKWDHTMKSWFITATQLIGQFADLIYTAHYWYLHIHRFPCCLLSSCHLGSWCVVINHNDTARFLYVTGMIVLYSSCAFKSSHIFFGFVFVIAHWST